MSRLDLSKAYPNWVCLFLLLAPLVTDAQREAYNWVLADSMMVDFSDDTVKLIPNINFVADEASATISDKHDNLLFYTNGVQVYNRDFRIMLGGDSGCTTNFT
jgi:hypothetical protein